MLEKSGPKQLEPRGDTRFRKRLVIILKSLSFGLRHVPPTQRFITGQTRQRPRMRTNRSTQGFTLVEIMIVVVIIGLLAAMAIPAFQKVRTNSQDKAVLNNARQLSAAADQYYLENGVSAVVISDAASGPRVRQTLNSVASEVYPRASRRARRSRSQRRRHAHDHVRPVVDEESPFSPGRPHSGRPFFAHAPRSGVARGIGAWNPLGHPPKKASKEVGKGRPLIG
jgi:type IV pilus assembly protein PilA